MRTSAALLILSAVLVSAQTETKTLHYDGSAQELQTVATVIRSIGDIRDLSQNEASLTVKGSPEQLELATWLLAELSAAPSDAPIHAASRIYHFPVEPDSAVRVLLFGNMENDRRFQEAQVAIRTVTDIRRVFTLPSKRAVALRGSNEQIALADWMFEQMDRPLTRQTVHAASAEFLIPNQRENVVRMFTFGHAGSEQNYSDASAAMRLFSQARRVFPINGTNILAVRGTRAEMDIAAWMFEALDRPATDARDGKPELLLPQTNEVLRILYLRPGATPQEAGRLIQAQAGVRQVFSYPARRALVVRGTVDQILRAEQMIQ